MRLNTAINILSKIRAEDEVFLQEMAKKMTAGTFCCECKKNTHVGLYPFWHIFRRELCETCGREYTELIKTIGAE